MIEQYDFKKIESKWQQKWAEENLYKADDTTKPNYYCLEMFPYPSGNLHMGHVRNYSIGDVIARFKTMHGIQWGGTPLVCLLKTLQLNTVCHRQNGLEKTSQT